MFGMTYGVVVWGDMTTDPLSSFNMKNGIYEFNILGDDKNYLFEPNLALTLYYEDKDRSSETDEYTTHQHDKKVKRFRITFEDDTEVI